MMPKENIVIAGFIGMLVTLILLNFFTGGEKLSRPLRDRAEAIPETIKKTENLIEVNQNKYRELKKSSDFKPVMPFAEKENWDGKFQLAYQTLDRASDRYKKQLRPKLKENRPEVAPAVIEEIRQIHLIIDTAKKISQEPVEQYAAIRDVVANAESYHKKATQAAGRIDQIISSLQTGVIAKAVTDFPDLEQNIYTRFKPAQTLNQASAAHLQTVNLEFDRLASGRETDFAAFADAASALTLGLEEAASLESSLTEQMGQLYTSYTKILQDMKAEFFVTIKRESWNDNADVYRPSFATFTRQVSPETFETLTAENIDTIGLIKTGFTGSRFVNQVGNAWNEMRLNPADQWPHRSHNAASFWVDSSRQAFYHKYILERDGETTETDWQKVDFDLYEANLDFLGMAILAKPYGTFESDRLTQAAPPGMAYVGNPEYGEWKEDDNGDRFWSWYGKYMFFSTLFFPPSYYYYNSWYGWHNNYRYARPYFGQTPNGLKKYGTHGTFIKRSPKFQNTHFTQSGGFRTQAASIRGAGAGLRGGGPKARGK
ncbi:MAG: hypothetical protein MI862_20840 [Desulfobacterales bacterium]|nr:hypothetical protein [Desulfobacterales bacterium]